MRFFGTDSSLTALSGFLLTLTLSLSLSPALVAAAPNPVPAPAEGDTEVGIAVAEPSGSGSLQARAPPFCFMGWNGKNYQGTSQQACCNTASCCSFENFPMLVNNLYSAKATLSDNGGVWLWTGSSCTGARRWVDFDGWWNLENAPAYRSMSQYIL